MSRHRPPARPVPRARPRDRSARRLRVLLTNDDGVDAPGLDAVARALAANSHLDVTVVAPATNQTGASGSVSLAPLEAVRSATASGHAATAVTGTPADTVLFAVHHLLDAPPDLVVAGINAGPNLAEFISVSGTVAAALTAASLGVPAVAVSQGLALEMDYTTPARFVVAFAERFRRTATLRAQMTLRARPPRALVLNVNFPACTEGAHRGLRVVPLGRLSRVTAYTRLVAPDGRDAFVPTVVIGDVSRSDCRSRVAAPADDLDAFNQGFATLTLLAPDLAVTPVPASIRSFARWAAAASAPRQRRPHV
jgi:5'-nucleotidase